MAFSNLAVDTAALPRVQELELTPMPPAYRREVLTQLALVFAPAFLVAAGLGLAPVDHPVAGVIFKLAPVMVGMLALGLTWFALRQVAVKGYALRDHDIAYRKGLVFRKTIMLPFNRVQHIEVASGPLQRRFGLATLKFFTAGGASVDLKMEGLLAGEAERLREFILVRSAAARLG